MKVGIHNNVVIIASQTMKLKKS